MQIRKSYVLAAMFLMAGCANTASINSGQVARVPVIVAALKCAFAEALIREKETSAIRRLEGSVAAGSLTLNLVHTSNQGINVSTAGGSSSPFVLAFTGIPISILPSFSNSVTRTDTIKTVIDFRFLMSARNTDVCSNLEESDRARIGLSDWLAGIIRGVDLNVGLDPPGQLDKLQYSSDFGVVNTTGGGVDFDFVFLKAGITASETRNDVQSLSFVIAPMSKDNPPPAQYGASNPSYRSRTARPATAPKGSSANPPPTPARPGIGPLVQPPADR